MRTIDLSTNSPTLPQVLQIAGEDDVILETMEGRRFAVVEIDDFEQEISAAVKNQALMKLLAERSKESTSVPLSKVRAKLSAKKTRGIPRRSRRV